MIDPNTEIERLRQRLRFKNLSEKVIDSICDDVSRDISLTTSDILASAMDEAVSAGADVGSEDFVNEVRAARSGATFDIVTDSGRTDFSEPPFPMLPKLLKNAKVAKDGSLYKVIPIRRKGSYNEINGNKTSATTEAAFASIENARRRAKEDKANTKRTYASPDAMQGMDTLSAMQTISKSRQKEPKMREQSREPVIDFRTASSKQDAATQWVNPGKQMNMSGILRNINADLHDSIDRAIEDIIRNYEGGY